MKRDLQPALQPASSAAGHAAGRVAAARVDDAWPLGAHLVSERAGYSHHGIYVGGGRVVHYAGLCESLHRGPIEEVELECFAHGHSIHVEPHPHAAYAGRDAVLRARSRLGENRYRVLTNNCEHFCTWCVDGKGHSRQVRTCVMHPRAALRFLLSMCRALVDARQAGGCCEAAAMWVAMHAA
ncbi:lecithin retinol acyltransferase family protein [Burkholderia guangdongensis]|uniref:lecithin retinol acyltransferase family protein n=1 Tax=Burkholderia guangdongensis TaxID=1792500 RepID=UPI0015CABF37|nr:lecithin retinol acyltransferase family protein [Burkholderia guangdongensis]